MPELPEVETTRRGVAPHLDGQTVTGVVVRNPRLRWPVPDGLGERLAGARVLEVGRRGKYLLVATDTGHLIIHLGMSGSLRILGAGTPPEKHDHFDLLLDNGKLMRLRDPRRFGAVLFTGNDPALHPLIAPLGIEPLDGGLTGRFLHAGTRQKSAAVKQVIMDAHFVVGVGNIYANESLFGAGIHPATPANRIGQARYERLALAIRDTLERAIAAGGSSLRDFLHSDGKPGYFQQQYFVYGRQEQPCRRCGEPIRLTRMQDRSTYYCAHCQRK